MHFKTSYGSVAEAINYPDGIAVLGIMVEVSPEDNPKFESVIQGLAKIHEAGESMRMRTLLGPTLFLRQRRQTRS